MCEYFLRFWRQTRNWAGVGWGGADIGKGFASWEVSERDRRGIEEEIR